MGRIHSDALIEAVKSDVKLRMPYNVIGVKNNLNKNKVAGIMYRLRHRRNRRRHVKVKHLIRTDFKKQYKNFGTVRIEYWPEGLVVWVAGDIKYKSWE